MLRIPVTYDLKCVVPLKREECNQNSPHCYIFRNGQRVAIVYLDPVRIEKDSDLLNCEKEAVLSVVTENQYELEEAYRRIANGW